MRASVEAVPIWRKRQSPSNVYWREISWRLWFFFFFLKLANRKIFFLCVFFIIVIIYLFKKKSSQRSQCLQIVQSLCVEREICGDWGLLFVCTIFLCVCVRVFFYSSPPSLSLSLSLSLLLAIFLTQQKMWRKTVTQNVMQLLKILFKLEIFSFIFSICSKCIFTLMLKKKESIRSLQCGGESRALV